MKKLFLFFALLAGIAVMTSCQKDQDVVTLKAVIDQDSKAYFGDNDHLPYWDGSDRVNVNGTSYPLDPESFSTTFATISNVTASANNVYCAVYPARACEKIGTPNASGTPATIYYEPEQKFVWVGNETDGHQRLEMPMGAVATSTSTGTTTLFFKNLSSILRINVANTSGNTINVKRLTVQAFGVYLAGCGTVTLREEYTESTPLTVTMDRPHNRYTDNNVITLCNRDDYAAGMKSIDDDDEKSFDVVVPPFENAYYLIVEAEYTNSDGEWYYTSDTVRTAGYLDDEVTIDHSSSITVERNKIVTASIEVDGTNIIPSDYAYLLPGQDFNDVMQDLFDQGNVVSIFFNNYPASDLPPEGLSQTALDQNYPGWKIVSTAYSPYKIYAHVTTVQGQTTVLINSRASLLYADKDCSHMFEDLTSLKGVNWNTSATGGFQSEDVTDMSYMFAGCRNLANLDGSEITSLNTTNVTTMAHMFENCTTAVNIVLNTWNTHNLKDDGMVAMFKGCTSLQMVDLSSFTTKYVTDMTDLFNGCTHMNGGENPNGINPGIHMENFVISDGTIITDMCKDLGTDWSWIGACSIYCKGSVQTKLLSQEDGNYVTGIVPNKITWNIVGD